LTRRSPDRLARTVVPGVLALLALLALLVASAGAGLRVAAAQADVFPVSVTRATTSRGLASDFLGLALEYNTIPRWAGNGSQPVDPVLVQLIRNLDPTGKPLLRIGGQSTDRTWWPVPGTSRPLGVTYDLSPAWTASARALVQATGAKLVLGLNLEADRPRIDQVEAAHLVAGLGRSSIAALDIGNEPDLYTVVPWYRPSQFATEFARALKVVPGLPIAGPETSTVSWFAAFTRFLSSRSRVRMLTSHAYGLNQCVTNPSSPAYPSVPHMLSLSASRGLLSGLTPYIALAHRSGATYRVDEMGSVSCNGRAGVSDTMASALWVMDALFSIAADDVDGVNLHTYPDSVNGLFDFELSQGHWLGIVHPLYYGALMFAQAAPAGSRLLRLAGGGQAQLRAWATLGADHRVRVLLINDSVSSSAQARVHAPAGYHSGGGSVERLLAGGAYATSAITLGGQSFGAATPTGVLPAPALQTVAPRLGTYTVTLPASSAALLTLPPG
jgi:hypothetical protein